MSKETFWFKHDYDAADDDKTMLLIEQLGLEGYGIYWLLIEKLRGRNDYKMPFAVIPSLSRRYMTTPEKMKTVITQYGLFEYDDDGFFYSVSLIERMNALDDIKSKRSAAGKLGNAKRWGTKILDEENCLFVANESQCDSNAIASCRDKNRIDKIREDIEEKEIDKSISKKKQKFDVREDLSYVEEMYIDIWNEWLDYKDEIKKQYKTQRGAKSQYKSLVKFANNNPILANAIVKTSIEHSWDGLFSLTDKQIDLFLSSKSPYTIDRKEKVTQRIDEKVIINGQTYR